MAITVTLGRSSEPANPQVPGARRAVRAKVAFDTSYPTGGYAVSASTFGLATLDSVVTQGADATGTYLVVFDETNSKLLLYSALGTQVTNATDVHTASAVVQAFGL